MANSRSNIHADFESAGRRLGSRAAPTFEAPAVAAARKRKAGKAGSLTEVRRKLKLSADPSRAVILRRYFQCFPGGYGYPDSFVGVTVPSVRHLAAEGDQLPVSQVFRLLQSRVHEERLLALLILVRRFRR